MTERDVQLALGTYVQWWRVICVPNLCRWNEMDLAVVTQAGYLWEYEIKVSQSDWNRDNQKRCRQERFRQWAAPVKRFHYVYARGLVCPDWVHEDTGLIEAAWHISSGYRAKEGERVLRLRTVRAPKDRKVEKIPDRDKEAIQRAIYCRYWRLSQKNNGN
jgi:hypothetical protein